jgi:hypothetical protein
MYGTEDFQMMVIRRLEAIEARLNIPTRLGLHPETEEERIERERQVDELVEAAGRKFKESNNVPTL